MTDGENKIEQSMLHQRVFLALVTPSRMLSRLSAYQTSEDNNRHTEAEMSILRYALAGYLTGVISTECDIEQAIVEPFADEVDVTYTDGSGNEQTETIEYPGWLVDFFDADDNFELMLPDNSNTLADILEHMTTFAVENAGPMEEEIGDDDAEADAAQGDDPGSEQAEAESTSAIPDESEDDTVDRVFAGVSADE